MYGLMELPNPFARASGRIMGVDVDVLEAISTTMRQNRLTEPSSCARNWRYSFIRIRVVPDCEYCTRMRLLH